MDAPQFKEMLSSLYKMKFPNSTRRETKLINVIGKKIRGGVKLTPDEISFVRGKIEQYKDTDQCK
ncbi:MAG: hypothetical protein ACRDBG_28485, partial [Waterburya sp.]